MAKLRAIGIVALLVLLIWLRICQVDTVLFSSHFEWVYLDW